MATTAHSDSAIDKVANALFELEQLGQSLADRSTFDAIDCNRFGTRIHELRARAIGLLEILTDSTPRRRAH